MLAVLILMIVGLLYVKRNSLEFMFNHIMWGVLVIVGINSS